MSNVVTPLPAAENSGQELLTASTTSLMMLMRIDVCDSFIRTCSSWPRSSIRGRAFGVWF